MSSKLGRPLTDNKGEFIDYEARRQGNNSQGGGSSSRRNSNGNSNSRMYGRTLGGSSGYYPAMPHSNTSLGSAGGIHGMPEPRQYNPQEDGGMQNLTNPPDYNAVYPQAAPVGPAAGGNLGRQPQTVECPWCHSVVTTQVKRQIGKKSAGAAMVLAVLVWPLFWVPLVIPGLQRKTHYCPQCRRKIGRGRRGSSSSSGNA